MDTDTDEIVVIRTFTRPLTAEQRLALLDALGRLCDLPLDHESIARPIACGIVSDEPYLVHAYLPGEPVDEFLTARGPCALADVSFRVTHLAGAIDFAAAAGVHHGALGPRDIIFSAERTGVSGFGLVQALRDAGLDTVEPTLADDVYALAAMTFELLTGKRFAGDDIRRALAGIRGADRIHIERLADALESALSPDPARWPASALELASALHEAQHVAPVRTPAPSAGARGGADEIGRLAFDEFTSEAEPPLAAPATAPADRPVVATPFVEVGERPDAEPTVVSQRTSRNEAERTVAGRLLFDLPLRGTDPASTPAAREAVVADPDDRMLFPVVDHGQPRRFEADPVSMPEPGRSRAVPFALATVAAGLLLVLGLWAFGGGSANEDVEDVGLAAADTAPESRVDDLTGERLTIAPDVVVGEPDPAGASAEAPREGRPAEPAALAEPTAPSPEPARDRTPQRPAPAPPAVVSRPAVIEPPQGRVLVRSDPPGARVTIDGTPRGETPIAIRGLELGTRTMTVAAPGYPVWERRVTLTSDRPSQSFEIALADAGRSASAASAPASSSPTAVVPPAPVAGLSGTPGAASTAMHVESRPSGARVWINGSLVGTTPLLLSGVHPGAHAVRIELSGYRPWETSIEVGRGERARVAASLEP